MGPSVEFIGILLVFLTDSSHFSTLWAPRIPDLKAMITIYALIIAEMDPAVLLQAKQIVENAIKLSVPSMISVSLQV